MEEFAKFIRMWTHKEYPPDVIEAAKLARVETVLGVMLPSTYRGAVLRYGAPAPTSSLLEAVLEAEDYLPDVARFLGPDDIIEYSKLVSSEDRPFLLPIAIDSMGNLIGYKIADLQSRKEPAIFRFDHDDQSVELVASSFEEWISKYNSLIN